MYMDGPKSKNKTGLAIISNGEVLCSLCGSITLAVFKTIRLIWKIGHI